MACLGPQTAPQVLPVEVPSAAGEGDFEGNDAPRSAERLRANQCSKSSFPSVVREP